MFSRNALVTGSTSGLGLGIANILLQSGCNVMIHGRMRDISEGEVLCQDLRRDYVNCGRILCDDSDLASANSARDLVSRCEKEFGGIDILVNNAGVQHVASVVDFPDDQWDLIIAVNLSAYFHTIKHALPGMIKRNYGRVINIASTHGLVASRNKSAYVAAKHGVVGLTKAVALDVAEHDITCNAVCPGFVMTPLVQSQIEAIAKTNGRSFDKARLEFIGEKHANKRFVNVEEVAEAVDFIVKSRSMTGSCLVVDGGWTAY